MYVYTFWRARAHTRLNNERKSRKCVTWTKLGVTSLKTTAAVCQQEYISFSQRLNVYVRTLQTRVCTFLEHYKRYEIIVDRTPCYCAVHDYVYAYLIQN